MPEPSIIRTEFASAEDAADVYGVPHDRVAALRRVLSDHEIVKEVKRDSIYLKSGEKHRTKAALARKRRRKGASNKRS